MSKICQCKKDAIKKICLLHRNNFLLNCKENGFWFWLIDNLQKAYESSYKWEEIKQTEQVVIAEAKYVDGEWRYFEEKGGICVVTDCHILKNYTRPEKQPKKLGRPKKSK